MMESYQPNIYWRSPQKAEHAPDLCKTPLAAQVMRNELERMKKQKSRA